MSNSSMVLYSDKNIYEMTYWSLNDIGSQFLDFL